MTDEVKTRGDEFREVKDLKIVRPSGQTSRTKGLTRPVVEVSSAPLPQNGGDALYHKYGESESGSEVITPERQRDELGRYATGKDKK